MGEGFANLADPNEVYSRAAAMQFWLTYWIVVATLYGFEYLLYYVVIWIPFYYLTKVIFLLWLFMPATRGANHVYHWFVSPILRRNRRRIDAALEESGRQIDESRQKLQKSVGLAVHGVVGAGMNHAMGAGAGSINCIRRGLSSIGPGAGEVAQLLMESATKRRSGAGDPSRDCD